MVNSPYGKIKKNTQSNHQAGLTGISIHTGNNLIMVNSPYGKIKKNI